MWIWQLQMFCFSLSPLKTEYGLRLASHIFVKDISPESLAARDGNIQEGDVVLKVRKTSRLFFFSFFYSNAYFSFRNLTVKNL